MKTPIDATGFAGATVALLNSGVDFQMADLWSIRLNGGTTIRWHGCGFNTPLTFNGNSWTAGPVIDRGKITTKLGLEVATLDVVFSATPADLINGAPLIPFARGNGFDGATVKLERAYVPAWGQPIAGTTIEFAGRVTALKDVSRSKFTMTVSSWTVLLNVNMGPDVFQAGCLNTHYDADCGLTPAPISGAVTGAPSTTLMTTNLTQADGYFSKGILTFSPAPAGGQNAGLSRAVQMYTNASGTISFAFPLPFAPAPGDAFTAVRGCLLTMADCTAQSNLIHFRGQPFTPPAITGNGV